jgi:uncharacterized protein YcbK (DUF882 family)
MDAFGAHHGKAERKMEITRRKLIGYGATALSMAVARPGLAAAVPRRRDLTLHNIHTGESFSETYWADGRYIPGAMAQIRYVLRDHRTNTQHAIDPALLDLLAALRTKMQSQERFEVISGYRSPATNDMLCETTSGVARHSMHPNGKAIDIRLPGRDLTLLRDAALSMKRGGVGYYHDSDFVHVDTGPVRHW